MSISSPGIGSNLDVSGIVNSLMQVESQPLLALQKKEAAYTAELSAFGTLSGALSAFQASLSGLTDASKFKTISAASSDATIVSASATKDAVKGAYNVNITQLAQAQTIASAGQVSASATIGSGASTTLTFQFGSITGGSLANGVYTGSSFAQDATQASRSITIDSTNNSLQGIRDAINKAAIGVTATIISDGSGAPNRLVLNANKSGATSSMSISVAGDATLQGLLAYAPDGVQNLTQSNAAQSAALTINGVAVTSATNSISGAIQGVTLNAAKTGTSTVTVNSDSSGVKTGINSFIKAYNELNSTISNLTAYDPKTKKAGALLGDATTRSIQTSMRRMFATPVPGLNGSLTNLSQLGIAFQKDGSLALDASKLDKALSTNLADVTKLLATSGSTTDSLVSFVSSTSKTPVGTSAIYVSQLAAQASVTGGSAAGLTITAGVNDKLSMTIDGISATTTLVAGTYTADSLATHIQSIVNGTSEFSSAGLGITVAQNSGILSLTSNKYGSTSSVSVSGSGAADLLGTQTTTAGLDAAGTIGGSAATGSGQFLTGANGSSASGIQLQITGGSVMADRGTVNISQGYAFQFSQLINNFLGTTGLIPSKNSGLNSSIKAITNQQEVLNRRLVATEKRLRAQFTSLDVTISSMTKTSTFLTQQLAQISNITG